MVAKEYGQPPHDVVQWPTEWLAAASTALEAEHGARSEIAARDARRARMKRGA